MIGTTPQDSSDFVRVTGRLSISPLPGTIQRPNTTKPDT